MIDNKEQKGVILFILILTAIVFIKNGKWDILQSSSPESNLVKDTSSFVNVIETVNLNSLFEDENNELKNKKNIEAERSSSNKNANNSKVKFEIKSFAFNPNNISKDSLRLLGVSGKVAYNWTKYIKNGGHFYSKKDVKKIYGLSEKMYERLDKLIILPRKNKNIGFTKKKEYKSKNEFANNQNKHSISTNLDIKDKSIEINSCQAEDLIVLRGIGEVLSKRIVKYRDVLGGFVSVNQLKEVYGLPEETYESIKSKIYLDKEKVKKLRINIENKNSLKKFPYISYRLASQIVKYRNQHGDFNSLKDFSKIKTIDRHKLQKLEPYLDYASN